jgi:hypothetical protein
MVSDTSMVYAGLKDDAEHADLVAYLETLSGGTGGLLRRTTRITSSLSAFTARTGHAVSARLRTRNPLTAAFKRQGGERRDLSDDVPS